MNDSNHVSILVVAPEYNYRLLQRECGACGKLTNKKIPLDTPPGADEWAWEGDGWAFDAKEYNDICPRCVARGWPQLNLFDVGPS